MTEHTVARAYASAARTWGVGPARIYDALADELVRRSPIDLAGLVVADVGSGLGAAARAARRVGARPIALDLAEAMLATGRTRSHAAAVAGDARALPLATNSVGAVVAAFAYNHLAEPERGLAEAGRVTRRGGVVLASAYAVDDEHPVKAAVDGAARAAGWVPDRWSETMRRDDAPRLATVDRAVAVARAAGLANVVAEHVEHRFDDLGPAELVEWRMGMAAVAPFLESLGPSVRAEVAADALDRLGTAPRLVRRMIVLAAVV